jgi:large repetitive protein
MAGRLRLVLALLLVAMTGLVPQATAAAETIRTFGKVFGAQVNGAIRITGNSLETCDTTVATCRAALAGSTANASNNEWVMRLLDADTDASTKSSSAATVSLPDGAKVLYAGLFWGSSRAAGTNGTGSSGDGKTIKLRVPGQTAYQAVTAGRTDYLSAGTQDYSSYFDVTSVVQAAGNGEYWGADIAAGTGADRYAGWSLVIAYEHPNEPLRDLTVFNGYARVTTGDVIKTSISGFLAPPSGPVNARFGSVTYEGDAGISGDYFAVNGTRLADAQSPSANFFGSRVTDAGANLTNRTPASVNNLGLDAKVVDAAGILANSSTSAELTFASTGDFYYPAALTTQIDLYAPAIHGTKTVRNVSGNDPAKIGDTLEYTLSYGNTGDDDALKSVVRDALPPNTTFVPGSLSVVSGAGMGAKTDQAGDDQAEYDGASRTVRYRIGAGANATVGGRLGTNESSTVRFRVTLDDASAGTTVVNTGYLDYTAETLNKPYSYRADEVRTPVGESADVALTKTGMPDAVRAGGSVTYKLVARNNGPSTARAVSVADTLPDGVELVSAQPTQGSCTGKVDCDLGELASGAEAIITVVVRVPAASTATGLTNVATATSTTSDPNQSNNNASVTTPVTRAADLSIDKVVAPTDPAPGEVVKYTLTIRNNGPSDAEQVRIADSLPAGLSLVKLDAPAPAGCAAAGQDITCEIDRLAGKATLVIAITATLDSAYQGGPLVNTARVGSVTPDPDPSNNTDTATVTPGKPKADLVVGKKTITSPIVAGKPVTYQISVRNDGPSDAKAVAVADDLSADLTEASADTTAGSCTVSGGQVRCALGDLGAGSTATVTVTATVVATATGSLVNTAKATSTTPDPDPSNNTGRTTDDITTSADLAITKTAQPVPVQAGKPVTYTLKITNNGPSAAKSVTVTDPVPAPLKYASSTASQGECDQADGTVSCAVGTVVPGATVTVTVVANVPSGTPPNQLDNTAKVSSPTPDPVLDNNTATYTLLTGAQANITLVKTTSPDPVVAGTAITFKLTVGNAGPSDAQDVTVDDAVPAAVTGATASATGGASCEIVSGKVHCSIGTLAAGESFVVTVNGMVAPDTKPGELANTATAGSRTPEDPTESDNTSTSTTTVVAKADLSIVKTAPATVVAGNQLSYQLTVRNEGPSDAVAAVVTDTLPAGTTYVRGSSSAGNCVQDPSVAEPVVICPAGRLGPGDEVVVTIVVIVASDVPAGKLTNRATVSSQTPDPNDQNNTGTAETTVSASADLSITKTVEPSPLVAGGEGIYTLTVRNAGPSTAQAVSVVDTVPRGLTLLTATSADGGCTVNGSAVSCALGTMAPGAEAVVLLRVKVASAQTGAITNSSSVSAQTPDPDPSDNTSSVTTEVVQAADLEVIKTSDEKSAIAGGGVVYRVAVVNHGPSDATSVEVSDTLPAGLTPISVETGQGSCTTAGQSISCALGALAADSTATVVITAALDSGYSGTSLANTATATSPVPDPDDDNNSSTITIPVGTSADVAVSKQAEPSSVTPGSTFDYAIVVTNNGPSVARSVVVTDTLPAGLTVVSVDKLCQADGLAVRCELGDVPVGQVILSLRVRLAAAYDGATLTNTATATSPTPDPDRENNTGKVVSPVTALADLAITKTMSPGDPVSGQPVKFVLTARNLGPSDARKVVITDELPRGLTKVSASGSDGVSCTLLPPTRTGAADAPEAGTVQCGTALLAEGASVTVVVTAVVVPGFTGALENVARVGAATSDPVIGNNEAKAGGRTTQSANLSVLKTASSGSVVVGHDLSYAIAVHNAGPSAALGVTVTDELAAGLRLRKASGGCTAAGQSVTCVVGRVDPGATVKVLLEVAVDTAYAKNSVTNTATATSKTPDPDLGDNTSTVVVKVTKSTPTPAPPTVTPSPKPGDNLGDTGAPVGLGYALAALGLVLVGGFLVVVTRRPGRR